jgi:type IV secretory pathway TraG/TraD family ATPase VirD4
MNKFPNQNITILGRTNYQSTNVVFGIYQDDRLLHTYIIGQTGTGKSTLLKTKIYQDIIHNRGFCLIEPHGDLVESIHQFAMKHRKEDVIYLDVTDPKITLGYNPLRKVSFEKRALVASGLLDILKKLWADAWGVKLEHILRYILLALLDQPKATIEDIHKIMFDKTYRSEAIKHIVSESVKRFWVYEYPKYTNFDLMPIMNKIGAFLAYPTVKRILIENSETLSLRSIMDEGKILLVNVSKGHIGNDPAHILGGLLLTALTSASFSRISIEENHRKPFYVFLDEFHNFSSLSLINMLSELRKFKIGMTIAHQYIHQLEKEVQQAVIGNVGTKISFRIGHDDARMIANEMKPQFEDVDFMYLPNYHIYLTLMIKGKPCKPFSAVTIDDKTFF